jgi:CRISPR-associated endonuclease/helicase Cas3
MQQVYRGICLLPVLADSVVVFDEVHSFDVGLFHALKEFLAHFDAPVLCMTASLPATRRRQLEGLGMSSFSGEGLADLERLAELPRYRVQHLDSRHAAEGVAREALTAGKRVLWVVNTVDRCQALAQTLKKLRPICYHSRFTLNDRKDRHAEVIEAFQSGDADGRFAITTQVCEMSLDLDAHVLISESAPIPALIQRMGRCNRHATPDSGRIGAVYFYAPEADSPYQPDELVTVPDFIGEIADRTVSQSHLEALLERYTQGGGNEADRWTAFIDDGPWACGGAEDLRDGPDLTVQAVIDMDAYLRLRRAKEPTDGLVVPIPKYLAESDTRLPRHLRRAPAEHYDPTLGFMKPPVETGVLLV